jgi:hypothetical protein
MVEDEEENVREISNLNVLSSNCGLSRVDVDSFIRNNNGETDALSKQLAPNQLHN